METKIAKLRTAWNAGDRRSALGIAARFPRLENHAEAIQRGWGAVQNPAFYRQIGKDPDELEALAYRALIDRYQLEP